MLQKLFKQKKSMDFRNPTEMSLEEKAFYLSLYNTLPINYTLALHSDIINLNSLISNDSRMFSQKCLFLDKFSDKTVDFIVLDRQLQAAAVILFNDNLKKERDGFYKSLIDLEIPVFEYNKQERYDFKDLLLFLRNQT